MADEMDVDDLLRALASMGFELEDCQMALEAGNTTLESAVEWLVVRRSNPSNCVSNPGPEATVEPKVSREEVSSAPSDKIQASSNLSSRYTVSEEHQKSKEQFMEKERETARMEAKRRKLMEKKARQEVLQQIAADKANRRDKKPKPPAHFAMIQATDKSREPGESSKENKQCLIQIRSPSGQVQRQTFPSDAKLQDVVTFICSQYHLDSTGFELLQPFPHRLFKATEMDSTLVDLGLSLGGSLVVKKTDPSQPSSTSGGEPAKVNPRNASEATPRTGNGLEDINRLPSDSDHDRQDANCSHGNGNRVEINNVDDDRQYVAPPLFDRSPPPELDDAIRAPLQGMNPNVLGIGGMQNFLVRGGGGVGHMWGEGVKLGAVEHNPHSIDPVLRAHTPGESAAKRLEMRQQHQIQPEAGPSRVSHEELPLLHRDVQRLEDLCINHISHRLPGHQSPLTSLGMLPLGLCDKIMTHLMKIKALTPKAMQAFISCGLRHVKLDCYSLVTNELLIALRLHRNLTHLSLKACPLITDKALEAVAVLKRLKSLNLSQCPQLTDKCFFHIKGLSSLVTLQMDMTKITDRGVCHFLENAASCPNIVNLSLSGTAITDNSLAAMSGLKALKILALSNTKISSLEIVQHLPQLENLNISHCTTLLDDSLAALENHPSLLSLNLLSTNISNDGLSHLQGLKLSTLKLPNRLTITDEGLCNLQGLSLVSLDLSDYIHVTDLGVRSIANMTRLTQLLLSNTKLTDDGMKSLAALRELEELSVDRTVITDEGCTVLPNFQQLRILGLSSTRISNKLLLNGTLNHCKVLSKLNLSRTRVSNKRLSSLVLPLLSQLNLDWTRVTSDCLTLLTGCPSLKALRTNNCTPPSPDSEDSDDEQEQR
ncbi:uncharacterized protein [Pocillopora verrucosa]|uniref:uncharacterized protein n=1 Tax=Pocillopora verrucosa TaxID=203993 RepID=UPI00333F0542